MSLTPEEVIAGIEELLAVGLTALGQPQLAALAPVAAKLADAAVAALNAPTPGAVLSVEVQATDGALDTVEALKFPKG